MTTPITKLKSSTSPMFSGNSGFFHAAISKGANAQSHAMS
jgi:hypothetical protein